MDTKELLKVAYKKLKSYVFFDKTQLPLRDKIVAFEKEDFEEKLIDLADTIDSGRWALEGGLGNTVNDVINNIGCYITPKKLAEDSTAKGVYSNLPRDSVKIAECQYYIDMDVLGHVLGVAWILYSGYALDKEGYENSYGNRLKNNLMTKGKLAYSPYLFEPYFSQYETWRDNGLEQAKKLLSNNKSVIMMTLDFSRFFYSVNIDRETLSEITQNLVEGQSARSQILDLFLTEFVCCVIEKYSETVKYFDEELVGNRNILPIGFAPSNIIANYCLKKFDDAIIKGWNPTYYGRYVDDVLIIDKVENNSPIYEAVKNQNIDTRVALNYFLVNCDAWRKHDILCDKNKERGLFSERAKSSGSSSENKETEYEYEVNEDFLVFKGSKIVLQNKKAKVFYFDSSQSDILIRCFQKNLQKNISEFRYLPEDEPIFNFDDYTEIYNLRENAGPNKLNGVEECGIDKFELSKFLGKYMRISGLVDDNEESRFKKDIAKIFTREVTIANYSAWEKIFAILICNEYFDELKKFVDIILQNLATIEVVSDDKDEFANYRIARLIKKSLIDILYSGLSRTLSVVWGKQMSDIIYWLESKIVKFCSYQELKSNRGIGIEETRKYYCLSRMCDKYSMPISIDEFINGTELMLQDEGDLVNLTSCASFVDCLSDKWRACNIIDGPNDYVYYPYIFSVMDLTFANLIESLIKGDVENINCGSEDLYKAYNKVNFKDDKQLEESKFSYIKPHENEIQSYVKVGDGEFEKIRVAVANTELDDNLLIDLLRNSVNRTYKRYENMGKMVNEAIVSKANILILPEAYLPIGWLPIFARTCAKNQMAAVVGIEHVVLKNYVYNITATILPYTEEEYKYAYIHFHLKKHYAPHEKEIISSTGKYFKEGSEYTLYCWNDFWFPVYCCYELTSIKDRALFQSYADAVIAVEWNMDVNYYSNIVESLSRDMHCYCIQVNMAKYGDSRITQPTRTEKKDIIKVKGGKNSIILVDEIDLKSFRDFQLMGNLLQQQSKAFKVTPPDFDYKIVQDKKDKKLWGRLKTR